MSGGGPSQMQQTQPLPELEPFISAAGKFLTSQVGQPVGAPFPGPYAAPTTGQQEFATATAAPIAAGSTLPGASPFIDQISQSLQALTAKQQERDVADIEARYAATGAPMSTPAAKAVGDYLAQSGAGLTGVLGQLGLSGYEQGVGQQLTAQQLLSGLGQQVQNVGQQGIQNALAEYTRLQQSPYLPVQALGGALPAGGGYPQYSPSPVPGIIGGLAGLLSMPTGAGTLFGRLFGL